ncbi:type II secretion system protein [Candidatus Saccharibacteria bacterium]|nr:type II secretion system protein [Candidatus Saccharibacteria bacterium]
MDTKKSGFSIIEVALVLGIAGLIFVMAFIALPSLQASQRDADRKARVMEFISDVKTYQTNNSRGALPIWHSTDGNAITLKGEDLFPLESYDHSDWTGFIKDYIDKNFEDPTGELYDFRIIHYCDATNATGSKCTYAETNNTFNNKVNGDNEPTYDDDTEHTIFVVEGAICDGDQIVKANNNRSVAALQVLERAGRYCYNT